MNLGLGGAVLAAAVGLSACGIFGGDGACDFRQCTGISSCEPRCQEYKGSVASGTLQATCASIGGKAISGLCPREGIIGGCQLGLQGDGSKPVDWYYFKAPSQPGYADGIATVEDVKRECKQGTFTPAP